MITTAEAFEAMAELSKALRGYTPPPPPPPPRVVTCEYCKKPVEKCGCGAST